MKIALFTKITATVTAALMALGLTATMLKAQDELYTDAWGFDYEEARWDLVRNGKFESRVFVSIYEGGDHYYFGMMRNTYDPIVHVLGVSVEFADGSVKEIEIGDCKAARCLNQYDEYLGAPGSYMEFPIPPATLQSTLSALKSGDYIAFKYRVASGADKGKFKINTLSLKGSRKALEALERSRNPSPQTPVQNVEPSDALAYLNDALNNRWSLAREGLQDGTQRFEPAETPCTFYVLVDHPNTGKTALEVAFHTLDPNRIIRPTDILFNEKMPFLEIATLGSREVVKEWTEYPNGTSEFRTKAEAYVYFPENVDLARLKRALGTAIVQCIRDQS